MIVFKTMILIAIGILLCVLLISVLIAAFVLTVFGTIDIIRDLLKTWKRRENENSDMDHSDL